MLDQEMADSEESRDDSTSTASYEEASGLDTDDGENLTDSEPEETTTGPVTRTQPRNSVKMSTDEDDDGQLPGTTASSGSGAMCQQSNCQRPRVPLPLKPGLCRSCGKMMHDLCAFEKPLTPEDNDELVKFCSYACWKTHRG